MRIFAAKARSNAALLCIYIVLLSLLHCKICNCFVLTKYYLVKKDAAFINLY